MMQRSIMEVLVKGSREAVELYQKAFRGKVLCKYPNEHGNYMYAEIDAYGQVIAISEIAEDTNHGNTMMFCIQFGKDGTEKMKNAYNVLKQDALECSPIGKCDYSPCQFELIDKFGVRWCVFE